MKTTTAIALAVCLVSATASAQNMPSISDASFRSSMALDAYAKVEYRDADGKVIGFQEFVKAVAAGKSFSMVKESDHSLATVRVDGAKAAEGRAGVHGPAVGAVLPAPQSGMKTLDGRAFDAAGLRGHRTLLSLFFSECVPCIAEVPALNGFAQSHPEVPLYSVTFDDAATAREFVAKRGLSTPVVADAQDYLDSLRVDAYPMLLLVDAQGKVAAVRSGGGSGDDALTAEALAQWVDAID